MRRPEKREAAVKEAFRESLKEAFREALKEAFRESLKEAFREVSEEARKGKGLMEERGTAGKIDQKAAEILKERFGKDAVIALATVAEGRPSVRYVNAYYEDGAFYSITYGLSNKMRQMEKNPEVAVAGEWFTAHGRGISLGYFGKEENRRIADKLRVAFAEWIDNGHTNFQDENTIILCVQLTDGLLLSHGTRYDLVFS